jgi:predicted amidohydrolase
MILAMAQMAMSADIGDNFRKSLDLVDRAAGADLIFFPELQLSPFFPRFHVSDLFRQTGLRHTDYLLDEENWYMNSFIGKARERHISISTNFYMYHNARPCDTSLMFCADGRFMGRSMMVNIVSHPDFYETEYYAPSTEGYRVYDLPCGKVGVVICYDRHCPASVSICARKGAQLVIIPTANLKKEPMAQFQQEVTELARRNNVFIAMCNRVGEEYGETFAGESLVVSPSGELLQKAGDAEALIFTDFQL